MHVMFRSNTETAAADISERISMQGLELPRPTKAGSVGPDVRPAYLARLIHHLPAQANDSSQPSKDRPLERLTAAAARRCPSRSRGR
jgi:hypothetical protein